MKINIFKFRLLNYFKPSLFVKSINDIDIDSFRQQGFRLVICDLDNTLEPHFTRLPTKKVFEFINTIQKQGILFVIASNNSKKRVQEFCKYLNVDYIYSAFKPLIYKIKKILKKYNINIEDVIIIGDQVITDIWAANRLHCKSILTLPIVDSLDTKTNFLMNMLNKYIYKNLQNNNMLNNIDDKSKINEELYEIL